MGNNSTIGGGGFHHVAIKVVDFDATVTFYSDVLGFRMRNQWGEGDGRGALLDTGDGNYLEVFAGGKEARKDQGAWMHVAFRCDDVDAVTERVRAAGCEVTVEPKNAQMGDYEIRISFFRAPDGELVELFNTVSDNKL
ncbi:MAG: lactoylglutathione lyase-like lyase [Paenibacillus sp.]|jgi:catechol 2,3-dioxygenase-like lactoylglutathione lyase family enzyme|nr:lactoylglutathione lyase-like lyase [Paenibacillus sp.]